MSSPLGEMSVQAFLDEYWQKKPCLIRQALPDFVPELDVDDVAGLACDELADARLVSGSYSSMIWTQEYGPFKPKRLTQLPKSNWTLLVQDVEKHYPPLQSLLSSFCFIPSWRMDDLMISVAAPGGSVGPHVDQYDVFLLQAKGHRRWQIAGTFDPALAPGCELNMLAEFTPEQEWDLAPGDMLYLPPGVAHHGVALDTCMTWSIGLRAPSQADLLQALGEWLAETQAEGDRYSDQPASKLPRPGEISPKDVQGLLELMRQALGDERLPNAFLGSFISRYRLAHQPAAPAEPISPGEVFSELANGRRLMRNPWTRLAWVETQGKARLFAAGDEFVCSIGTAQALSSTPPLLPEQNAPNLDLISRLINSGHFYLESEDADQPG